MGTKNACFIKIREGDAAKLYELWYLKEMYSFNMFCAYFLMLDLPLLRDRSVDVYRR